ncbi:MAG: nucleotidyltransferase domain-containing protein [Verrucomicrobiota bacterium]|jgi:predicted nucleotidyltransferase
MPIGFQYDVFLSHSAKDKAVVRPLAERLRKDGLKVWFDEGGLGLNWRVDGWNGCCDAVGMAEAKVFPPGAQTTAAGSFREAPARLHFDRERLGHLCRERGVARLDVFGSALREDFREDSDVDLLAGLRPEACVTLLDWADLQEKLSEVFGRPVDLVSRRAVEGSQNPYRKQAILSTAIPIYVEGA